MTGWSRLPKDVRTQLGVGTILTFAGMVWIFVILFFLRPDQIFPTRDMLNDAHDGVRAIAAIPFDLWTFRTAADLLWNSAVLMIVNVLFVAARYGGLTLVFLGGFAVFDAISSLRRAQR